MTVTHTDAAETPTLRDIIAEELALRGALATGDGRVALDYAAHLDQTRREPDRESAEELNRLMLSLEHQGYTVAPAPEYDPTYRVFKDVVRRRVRAIAARDGRPATDRPGVSQVKVYDVVLDEVIARGAVEMPVAKEILDLAGALDRDEARRSSAHGHRIHELFLALERQGMTRADPRFADLVKRRKDALRERTGSKAS